MTGAMGKASRCPFLRGLGWRLASIPGGACMAAIRRRPCPIAIAPGLGDGAGAVRALGWSALTEGRRCDLEHGSAVAAFSLGMQRTSLPARLRTPSSVMRRCAAYLGSLKADTELDGALRPKSHTLALCTLLYISPGTNRQLAREALGWLPGESNFA